MVSFEIFVKSMPPSLSELKVLPSFCFAFKIPDDVAITNNYMYFSKKLKKICLFACILPDSSFVHSDFIAGELSNKNLKKMN